MSPAFDLEAYLARIDYAGPRSPDLATLRALITAHLAAIPFENIDPMAGQPINPDLAVVQNKIVQGGRGGFCFELNGLLLAALRAMGFSVTPLLARVRWRLDAEAPHTPRNHLTLLVDFGQDGLWLADVGFGGTLADEPLRFVPGLVQETAMASFRLDERDGLFWLSVRNGQAWHVMYVFDRSLALEADFAMGSWYASTHPASILGNHLVMERVREGRRYKLVDRVFSIEGSQGEVLSSRVLASGKELYEVFAQAFGLAPSYDPDVLFARIKPPSLP